MPSIRQTLQEMGASAEQVLSELAQMSSADSNHRAVPTPLTNYLDVRHFLYRYPALNVFIFAGSFLNFIVLFA